MLLDNVVQIMNYQTTAMKNLQNTDSRSPANYLPTVNVLDRFLGFLFGDDIFISYSHRDAINYARAFATALRRGEEIR